MKNTLLTALKNGFLNPYDFKHLATSEGIIFKLNEKETALIETLNQRIEANPRYRDIFYPEIPIDRELKIKILKSLASGNITEVDLPEVVNREPVNLAFMLSVSEMTILSDMVDRNLDLKFSEK